MMEVAVNIHLPFTKDVIKTLKAGDNISVSGVMFTARDAAHKRMAEALAAGKPLPFDLTGQTIYYAGPCPAKPGRVIIIGTRSSCARSFARKPCWTRSRPGVESPCR